MSNRRIILLLLTAALFLFAGCAERLALPSGERLSIDEAIEKAPQAFQLANYEEAVLLYEFLLTVDPKNIDYNVDLLRAYAAQGRDEDVRRQRGIALAVMREQNQSIMDIAQPYIFARDWEAAEEILRHLGDTGALANTLRFARYAVEGRLDDMLADWESVRLDDPVFALCDYESAQIFLTPERDYAVAIHKQPEEHMVIIGIGEFSQGFTGVYKDYHLNMLNDYGVRLRRIQGNAVNGLFQGECEEKDYFVYETGGIHMVDYSCVFDGLVSSGPGRLTSITIDSVIGRDDQTIAEGIFIDRTLSGEGTYKWINNISGIESTETGIFDMGTLTEGESYYRNANGQVTRQVGTWYWSEDENGGRTGRLNGTTTHYNADGSVYEITVTDGGKVISHIRY